MKPLVIFKVGSTFENLASQQGDFEDWIAQGLQAYQGVIEVIDPRKTPSLPDPTQIAAAIVTGSHAMVTDREIWSEELAAWLKLSVDRQLPILGICYGHQLLAHAMDGKVNYHPQGLEIGCVPISLTPHSKNDVLFKTLPPTIKVHTTHKQSVIRLPQGAVLLAKNDFEPHHAYRIGPCAWGVQFHPEFNTLAIQSYIQNRCEHEDEKMNLINQVIDTIEASSILKRFGEYVSQNRRHT